MVAGMPVTQVTALGLALASAIFLLWRWLQVRRHPAPIEGAASRERLSQSD
jgi:hypothetical protein